MTPSPKDESLSRLILLVVSLGLAAVYMHLVLKTLVSDEKSIVGYWEVVQLGRILAAFTFAGALALSAWYTGWFVLALAAVPTGETLEAHFFRAAFGIGILMFAFILLLSLGLFNGWIVFLILLLLGLPGLAAFVMAIRQWRRSGAGLHASPVLLPSLGLLGLFLLLSLTPERDYDALEYHLPAAAAWAAAGHFVEIPYNVYTNFPMNVEVLYAAGLSVAGPLAPKVIHFLLGLGAAWGTYLVGRRLGGCAVGRWALLLFLSSATVGRLYYSSLIDLGVAFFGAAALLALMCSGSRGLAKSAVLAGVYAGLAFGSKYTSALTVAVPCLLVLLAITRKEPLKRRLAFASLYGSAIVILFLPWAIKNMIFKGNPFFPLFFDWFGGTGWDSARSAIFMDAHRSALVRHPENALGDLASAFWFWFTTPTVLLPVSCLAVLIFPWRRMTREAKMLLLYSVPALILWYVLTQGADRFLLPIFPAVSALAAFAADRVAVQDGRRLVLAVYLVIIATGIWGVVRIAGAEYPAATRQIARGNLGDDYSTYPFLEAIDAVNHQALDHPAMRVLFVGEARGYTCRTRKVVPTVFDRSPLLELTEGLENGTQIRDALRKAGYTHVLYNSMELARLMRYGQHGWTDGEVLRRKMEALMSCCANVEHEKQLPGKHKVVVFRIR